MPKVSAKTLPLPPCMLGFVRFGSQTYAFHEIRIVAHTSHIRSLQGPDAVHIQQIGQRELKRASMVTQRHLEVKKKEKKVEEKFNVKAHL